MTNIAENIVFNSINIVSQDSPFELNKIDPNSTPLLGELSAIDSLTLVRLLITIEQEIESQTGRAVSIVDESTFSSEVSPFSTVSTLISHIKSFNL